METFTEATAPLFNRETLAELRRRANHMADALALLAGDHAELKREVRRSNDYITVVRDDRDKLLRAAQILLDAMDGGRVMVVGDDHPDYPLREVVAVILERLGQ